jgi:hypothetical protein
MMGGMYMAAAAAAMAAAAAAACWCSGAAPADICGIIVGKGAEIAGIIAGTIGTMLAAAIACACACAWSSADCCPAYCSGALLNAAIDVTGYHCGICHTNPAGAFCR